MTRKRSEHANSLVTWLDDRIDRKGLRVEVDELVDQIMIQQRLTAMREKIGMSQRELARRVGVSQPVIARLESRKIKNVTLRTLVRAASALGATLTINIKPSSRRATRRSHAARRN